MYDKFGKESFDMKKLLVVMVVVLLALSLASCGGETATTTKATATTTAPATTTVVPETTEAHATTMVPTTTVVPETTTPTTTTPVTTVPVVTTTVPTTTVKEETPEIPDLSDVLDLGVAIVESKIEAQSLHDGNLVISLYVGDANHFSQLFFVFDSISGSNGFCTVREDYTVDVILDGVFKKNNRFSYNQLEDGSGWFSFEIGSLAELLDGRESITLDATLIVKDVLGRAMCYASFEDLCYNPLG